MTGPIDTIDAWDDWKPVEQTALDFLLAEENTEEDLEDDDDEWNPVCQGAAEQEEEPEEADEDSKQTTSQASLSCLEANGG